MKRFMSLILALTMCVGLLISAYAEQPTSEESRETPTLEDFREHFPELQLGESGYIGDIAFMAEVDLNEPLKTYTAVDDEDLYYVNVYPDNSYIAYGWIAEPTSISSGYLSKGINASGKVYVTRFGAMYDLSYVVTYDAQTPNITNVTYPVCTWVINYAPDIEGNVRPTEASATPIKSWYEKQTSGKAVAYGGAKLYQYGTYLGTLHLYLYLYGAGKKEVVVRSNFDG